MFSKGVFGRQAVRTMFDNEQFLAVADSVVPMSFNPSSSQEHLTSLEDSSGLRNNALSTKKQSASKISDNEPPFTLVAIIEMAPKSAKNNHLSLREIYDHTSWKFFILARTKNVGRTECAVAFLSMIAL